MTKKNQPTGMLAFTSVWFGQLVSLLGTGITRFALTIWAWEVTGEVTALALVGFFSFAPMILLSPVAGALVDRWNRKMVMMLSDLGAGLSTIAILLLFVSDNLQLWHLFVAGAFAGIFEAFQFPAYSAAISTMLPKKHYVRANGMLGLTQPASQVAAPLLGSFLLITIGLNGILLIDIVTFLFALGTLFIVSIPQAQVSEDGQQSKGSLWQESLYGFRYIFRRPSLLGLQLVFFMGNLFGSAAFIMLPALILARTDNDELILGTVQSIIGIGGVMGGLLLSSWSGSKHKIHGVLISWMLIGILGAMVIGVGQNLLILGLGGFFFGFFAPLVNGFNQAIWQSKVAPDVQGRVFATRRLIAQITFPVAILLAGPLADRIFEPAMMPDGQLAAVFGTLVGVGSGAGMGLMFVISGFCIVLTIVCSYFVSVVRRVEDILPDHDIMVQETQVTTE